MNSMPSASATRSRSPRSTATARAICWTPASTSFPPDDGEEYDEDVIKVAIIGKPNVGKSSLLNKILGEERVIVSNIAGTTRDAIDSYFENESGKFLFIDTAGMRRKSKVDDAVEKYSNLRSIAAIERADVCLILIDANEGVTEQDTKVAGLAHEAGKACIIVVNKWDTVEKDTNTMDEKTAEVRRDLSYMTYAPVVFISALTGQRVDKLFDMIVAVSNQNSMRITTGMLNNILEDATARVQPPTDKGRRLKIYYITQVGVKPPHFVFFCNDSSAVPFLVPAISGKPDPRGVRPDRHADPDHHPPEGRQGRSITNQTIPAGSFFRRDRCKRRGFSCRSSHVPSG